MNGELVRIKGFDDAIVGMSDENLGEPRLVYDVNIMVHILITEHGFTEEESYDWISYNVVSFFLFKQKIFIDVAITSVD